MSIIHTYTGNPLDRAAAMRRDPEWITARLADPDTRFLLFQDLHPLLGRKNGGVRIEWLRREAVAGDGLRPAEIAQHAVLLGLDANGIAHFALPAEDTAAGLEVSASSGFQDTRASTPLLPAAEAAIIAQARSLLSWHDSHPFCARCGGETASVEAGYSRLCSRSSCGASHFPRTDPVVIMVVSQGDRVLLGRSVREPRYPVGMFSCLAGYIEPGESLEEAVRRETREEAGIEIGRVSYHSSQPWPFPSTLMIGCFAEALSDRIDIDLEEVEEVRWFTRQEAQSALERWSEPGGVRLPPPLTAAHQLIAAWLEHDANGLCGSTRNEVGR